MHTITVDGKLPKAKKNKGLEGLSKLNEALSGQPTRDKIVQIAVSGDDRYNQIYGLGQSGTMYCLIQGVWELFAISPLLPVTEEK